MPYIKQDNRMDCDSALQELQEMLPSDGTTAGKLTYIISNLIWKQFLDRPSYEAANKLLGVLEAVKLEFYRRHVAPYEDEAIRRNGDLNP